MASTRSITLKWLSDTSQINKGVKDINSKLDGVGKMAKRLGGVMAAAFAADKVKDFAVASFKLGETAKEVTRAFDNLAGTSLRELRKATGGAVDDLTLMQKAVSANNLGIPVENLATLFEFASKRAAQTGENVNHLVDSIVTGIGRKSSLVLDNLGIVMSTAGKTTAEVSNEVLKLANEALPKMGDVGTKATDRLTTAWTNFQLAVGEFLAGPGGQFLDWVTNVLTKLTNALNRNRMLLAAEEIGEVEKALETAREDYYQLVEAMKQTELQTEQNINTLTEKGRVITELENRLKKLKGETVELEKVEGSSSETTGGNTKIVQANSTAIEGNTKAKQGNIVVTDNLDDLIQDINKSIEAQTEAVKTANFGYEELIKSYAESYETGLDFNAEMGKTPDIVDKTKISVDQLTNSLASLAGQMVGGNLSLGSAMSQLFGTLGGMFGGPAGAAIGGMVGGLFSAFEGGTFGTSATVSYPSASAYELATLARLAQEGSQTAISKLSGMGYSSADYEGLFNAGGGGMGSDGNPYTGSWSDVGGAVTVNVSGFVGNEQVLANEITKVLSRNEQNNTFV